MVIKLIGTYVIRYKHSVRNSQIRISRQKKEGKKQFLSNQTTHFHRQKGTWRESTTPAQTPPRRPVFPIFFSRKFSFSGAFSRLARFKKYTALPASASTRICMVEKRGTKIPAVSGNPWPQSWLLSKQIQAGYSQRPGTPFFLVVTAFEGFQNILGQRHMITAVTPTDAYWICSSTPAPACPISVSSWYNK